MTENHHPKAPAFSDPAALIAAVDALVALADTTAPQTRSPSSQTPSPSPATPSLSSPTHSPSSGTRRDHATRWKPGQSGNPLGRPRRAPDGLATPAVLRALTMRVEMEVDGRPRSLRLTEALVRATAAEALKGDAHARRDLMQMLADAERARVSRAEERARRLAAAAETAERERVAAEREAARQVRLAKDRERRKRWEAKREGE